MRNGLIEYYRDRLPLRSDAKTVSLSEGNTPLIRLHRLPEQWGADLEVYVKYEGLNPTGSFKDRGMLTTAGCARRLVFSSHA